MGRGGGGGRNRVRPSDYDSYRETPSSSNSSTGQSSGTWAWSDKGVNAGLSAGPKDSSSPHGDGTSAGTRWTRDDGTSGQSETRQEADGGVTHWQHDGDGKGGETVSGVTYNPDGSTTFSGHTKH